MSKLLIYVKLFNKNLKLSLVNYSTAVKNPGPGTYNVQSTINPNGRYILSRFANSGASIISPSTSKRFGPRPYGILLVYLFLKRNNCTRTRIISA